MALCSDPGVAPTMVHFCGEGLNMSGYLDFWSLVIIVITFFLFLIALFLKGLTHDLLLEAGVFLVSCKLILMAYKNSVTVRKFKTDLDEIKTLIKSIRAGQT